MSLLSEIQEVLERTYSPSGINLEHCLIGSRRSAELAALCPGSEGLTPTARTYLRPCAGNLFIGIYYDPALIRCLEEEDPRESISHRNVAALIQFMEEITHGVHAALAFRAGWRRWDSESFACALEAQARVDTYFLLVRFCGLLVAGPVSEELHIWIWERIFGDERDSGGHSRLDRRYRLARSLAGRFVVAVRQCPGDERMSWIQRFRGPSLADKLRLVRSLEN